MSVNYNSALIYGYSCDPKDWSSEDRDKMEELGWDVISDGYSDEFLYIGKTISSVGCYEDARVDCFKYLDQSEIDVEYLLKNTPKELRKNLPFFASLYHLCYAT